MCFLNYWKIRKNDLCTICVQFIIDLYDYMKVTDHFYCPKIYFLRRQKMGKRSLHCKINSYIAPVST